MIYHSCLSTAPALASLALRAESETRTMSETKRFTRAEISSYNKKDNNVFIVRNHVYDVKAFLDEHPGGHEVLVRVVGKDATEDFDDIGHSLDAKELMKKYRVGELVDEEKTPEKNQPKHSSKSNVTGVTAVKEEQGFLATWKLPIFLGIIATVVWQFFFN
ncbi:cytochrome b5-like [Cydia strobilella]|uniref:cytochrome b5-like n=1 Tax=Cydia strobilella TaxID=1100964 RepID=UPI0030058E22